jgi:hypothetical protein
MNCNACRRQNTTDFTESDVSLCDTVQSCLARYSENAILQQEITKINKLILQSALPQVQSLFQSQVSTDCGLVLPLDTPVTRPGNPNGEEIYIRIVLSPEKVIPYLSLASTK